MADHLHAVRVWVVFGQHIDLTAAIGTGLIVAGTVVTQVLSNSVPC
jgi:multidrug transporter EmrE-like cation transporter